MFAMTYRTFPYFLLTGDELERCPNLTHAVSAHIEHTETTLNAIWYYH